MDSDRDELPGVTGLTPKPAKKRRLFFALWPNNSVRKQIAEINRQLPPAGKGGRLMSNPNLHLTLHYIGPVGEEEIACLNLVAKEVESMPFTMELDRLGYFKRPRVLWLGCEERPAGYIELLERLAEKIATCGFKMEVEGNRPHVTLRRKVLRPKEYADIKTIEWQVDQFVLVESVPIEGGVSYRVIESYRLNGA